ncbi:hypothetical protein WJX82_008106 [Trebouxia sp. C0006]
MDGDGSGAIDVDELSQAFHVLGLHVTKQAVRDLVARVDSDGSGEVELPEFIQIMTMTREAEQEATFWGDRTPRKHSQGGEAVPLHYLTAAYRRKRTVDAIMDPELRQVYIDSPGRANNSAATAAVAAEVLEEPAMDLSATFRQSMRFNPQENADMGTAGTLFRSLAVDNFTPEPDDEDLYNPLSSNDRQTRREQIEEAVRARFAAEEADLQRVIEQRRWMSPSGRTKRKGQPFKKEARSAGRRVALSPPPAAGMTASRSSKPERAVSPLKQPAEFTDDNMQDESNMMSVTMLLRRSPELDVATIGQMNLISSKTLRLSVTPPSRCGSPDHVVSNTTHPVHKELVSSRPVPKGRNAVVPHVVHLRDLQSLNLGGNSDVSVDSGGKEFEGVRTTMRGGQAWDLTQGNSTLKGGVSGVSFALDGGESYADQEAGPAQDDALIKQASGSFPSWLTDGDDEALVQPQLVSSFGAEGLTQDEDEQQEQAAPQSNITWSSRDFHMSPKQGMQHTDGVKGDEVTQFASLSFYEKRSRMISHPTAVQINARLLAIRQAAKCC